MAESSPNARLEAFCDGVFAIALTLLIIDIRIPATEHVDSSAALWRALRHTWPAIFAFVLSFVIILITWVNHHAAMHLVNRPSAAFMYANGFLLLTVVFVPFPTALLGDYLLTDHAAPAVFLYNAVLAVQAIAWVLVAQAALSGHLVKGARSAVAIEMNRRFGYIACAGYSLFALAALWFPWTVAAVTTLTWSFWLILGITMKHE